MNGTESTHPFLRIKSKYAKTIIGTLVNFRLVVKRILECSHYGLFQLDRYIRVSILNTSLFIIDNKMNNYYI